MSLPTLDQLELGRNTQLEESSVHEALGEVDVIRRSDGLDVLATILTHPGESSEGWQTGVALDCSYSMKANFGGKNTYFTRQMTSAELDDYRRRGLLEVFWQDGKELCRLKDNAYQVMLQDGLLKVIEEENKVQDVCRKVIPMLAGTLDADGGTTVIYWAAGADGSEIKELGDLTQEEAKVAEYTGWPENWGYGTKLMPAIRYFLEKFSDAPMGFYVFVTDGKLDDFEEVKEFTKKLSRDIDSKKVNPVKLVLIGVGKEVDVEQLEALDDLPDECDLPVDVWDHKVAAEMRSVLDVFAEMVDENKIVAPSGEVTDDRGTSIRSYTDGLPAMLRFKLPLTAKGFKLTLPNGKTIEQQIIA